MEEENEQQQVSPQSQAIQQTVGGLVNQPQLPSGGTVNVQPMNVCVGETLGTPGLSTTAPTV